jgi:ferrochelatase
MSRIAVILANLGGPDSPAAVLPFLRNLFRDPAILRMPGPLQVLLAEWIAQRRAPTARGIYAHIGGRSPIREQCEAQAAMLQAALADLGGLGGEVRAFVAMRYWHPRAWEAAAEAAGFGAQQTVFLPLYPQFSTTTTESSLAEWRATAGEPDVAIGCYPDMAGFVHASADLIATVWRQAEAVGAPRLLFSAHGLPQRISDAGDPYSGHVERTAAAVTAALGLARPQWRVCYQSRVGRLEWIGPSTDEEIARAGADGVPVVVAPIAFTSEHSETLVELDIETAELARQNNVPGYFRAPTVGIDAAFIAGLAELVREGLNGGLAPCPRDPRVRCPVQACAPTEAAP